MALEGSICIHPTKPRNGVVEGLCQRRAAHRVRKREEGKETGSQERDPPFQVTPRGLDPTRAHEASGTIADPNRNCRCLLTDR